MKILIIKIGAIGDVIMSLPLIELIRNNNSKNEITWLVGESSFPLISKIDGVNPIKIDESKLLAGNIFLKVFLVFKTWVKIGLNNKYDLILIAHSDNQYKLLALPFLKNGNYRSFSRPKNSQANLIPGRHHTSEYLRLFHQNDSLISENIQFPSIIIGDSDVHNKRTDVTIAIAPGGAKTEIKDDKLRRWPIENYVLLAQNLIESGKKVVLIGGKTDLWVLPYFNHLNIENQIGTTGLLESIYNLKSMHCLITHDCGPMHFAALAEIPVLALFGPTNPLEKIPKTIKSSFIWGGEELPCRPCYDGKYYSKCYSNVCMQEISIDNVLIKLTKLLLD